MTIEEAIASLRVDPGHAQAWAEVDRLLPNLGRRVTHDAELVERAVQSVRSKLEDQAISGDLPEMHAPVAYLATMVRRRVIDASRRVQAARRAEQKLAAQARAQAEATVTDPFGPELLAAMERVIDRAVARRDAWQRDHLRRAWGEMRALATEPLTLRQLVIDGDGLAAEDAEAVDRAVQRGHKAHQRARAALLDALEELLRQGRMDAETGAALRAGIGRLKRRQDRAAPRVSGARGNAHAH